MPERLAPLSLIQVNAGFGIGGIRRETAGGNNGSGNPWEESPGTDWGKTVKGRVYGGSGRPTADYRKTGTPPYFPITCEEMGWVENGNTDAGRFRVYLQFHGIDLSEARFLKSGEHYLRPAGSDSAVYARLRGEILVIATFGDIIECQLRVLGLQSYDRSLGNFHFGQLLNYDPRRMGISVKGNLVAVGYPRP